MRRAAGIYLKKKRAGESELIWDFQEGCKNHNSEFQHISHPVSPNVTLACYNVV